MFGRSNVHIRGNGLDRPFDGMIPVSIRAGRRPGKGSRVAWIVAGAVAAAVTLTVVVWEVLDRTDDSVENDAGTRPNLRPQERVGAEARRVHLV